MTDSDKTLMPKLSEIGANPIPVTKISRNCKEEKLLSEFEFSSKSKTKHAATCKNCVEKIESKDDYGTCCRDHFDEALIMSAFHQLDVSLDCVDVIRRNGVQIPPELFTKI